MHDVYRCVFTTDGVTANGVITAVLSRCAFEIDARHGGPIKNICFAHVHLPMGVGSRALLWLRGAL
jgi:hypothetical protein